MLYQRCAVALWSAALVLLFTVQSIGPSAAAALDPWPATTSPGLVLETLDGNAVDLADGDHGVVVVHFFATWCEPCRDELTALDRLAREFDGQSFSVLAVDSGEPEARIRRFFREFPVSIPILLDGNRAALKAWEVTTFPTSFVVGGDGRPLWKAVGEVAWEADEIVELIRAEIDRSRLQRLR